MPWTAISARASFTSSSLNGLMMAMTSFISAELPDERLIDVAFFTVFGEIESLLLGLRQRSQADDHRHDFRQSVLHRRATGQIAVNRPRRQETGQKSPECPADSMDAECIEGIVVAEPRLHRCHKKERHRRREYADDYGPGAGNKTGGRRDHDQPGHRARAETKDGGVAPKTPLDHAP